MKTGDRARVKLWGGDFLTGTVLVQTNQTKNWVFEFDDGSIAQYSEKVLLPIPEPTPTPEDVF